MKIPNMTIKVTVEGLTPAALDTLAEMLNKRALEIILSDDQPVTPREARAGNMADALRDADKRGFDFGAATAQAMSTVDHLLEDAIGALDEDRLLVVFDRLTAARAELRDFWTALAEEMNLPLSYFVDDAAPAPELVKAEEAERAGEPGLAAAWRARTSPSLSPSTSPAPDEDEAP